MRRLSTPIRATAVAGLAAILLSGGCPSGTGDTPGQNSNINGGGGGGGGAISGDPVSAAQRSAALAAVDDALASQSPGDLQAAASAVVAALRANSSIARAGLNEDNSVWAIFTDGAPLVVALNRPIPEDVAQALLAAEAGAPKPRRSPLSTMRARATTSDIAPTATTTAGPQKPSGRAQSTGGEVYSAPWNEKAYLFNSYGPTDEMEGHLDHLHWWLMEAGYHIENRDRRATIENLRDIEDAGVLYVNGHGARGYLGAILPTDPDVPVYAFGTITSRAQDGSTDATYATDIGRGRIGYLQTPTIVFLPQTGEAFGRTSYNHYFITEHFIREYWTFARGGQAYFDLCDVSGTGEVSKACFDKQASVVLGWNGVVRTSDSIESSQFYFSRTLGATENYAGGKVAREEPPQRPFGTNEIVDLEMQRRARTTPHQLPGAAPTSLAESFQLVNLLSGQAVTSNLILSLSDATSGPLLRPSLARMQVDESAETITVSGDFGSNDWAFVLVTVGGQTVGVLEGGPGYLKCSLPPTAAGPVEVTLYNKKSNIRNLTLWSGTASVEEQTPVGTASLALDVKVRGDLLSYRLWPGEPPQEYGGGFGNTGIPALSRITGHGIDQTFACPRDDRSDNRNTVSGVGTYPPLVSLADLDDGFYFGLGAPPPAVDESGIWSGTFYWLAYIPDGVREEINCAETPRTETTRFSSPAGGVPVDVDWRSPNIHVTDVYTLTGTTCPCTYTSTLNMTASYPPSADDPR